MTGVGAILSYKLHGVMDMENEDSDEEIKQEQEEVEPQVQLGQEENNGEKDQVDIDQLEEFLEDVEEDEYDFM